MGRLLVVLAVNLVPALALGARNDPAVLGAKLDEYMTRLERLGYSGGLLVARNGDVLIEKGYGMRTASGAGP